MRPWQVRSWARASCSSAGTTDPVSAHIVLAAPALVTTLAGLAEPWNKLYADSKLVSASVLFLHLVPLVISGGTAWTADRATIRAARGAPVDRARQLGDLSSAHRLVVGGLALSLVSGVLLFASDVETFLPSPFFWVKLALVTLLLGNGFFMKRTEGALHAGGDETALWSRLRRLALLSAALWLATILAGVVLTNFA